MNKENRKIELEEIKGVSLWVDAFRRLLKNKLAVFGGIIVIFFIIIAILADVITPYSYEEINLPHQNERPDYMNFFVYPNFSISSIKNWDKFLDFIIHNYNNNEAYRFLNEQLSLELKTTLKNCKNEKDLNIKLKKQIVKELNTILLDKELHKTLRTFIKENLISSKNIRFQKKYGLDNEKNIKYINRVFLEDVYPELFTMGTYFGTDMLGRDIYSRLIYGSRISLSVGFITALVALVIGVTVGSISGFLGGKVDMVLMRFVDILYGMPYMFFVILLMVIFGRKFYMLFIGIGAVSWMTLARITRGQILSLKNNEYIEAARSIGASRRRIIFVHLLPNAIGPIIVYLTLTIPSIMLEEAFLSFLGLGVQAPMTSWGLMASDGAKSIMAYPWVLFYPGVTLAIVLFSLNVLGEGLRDALDPSMKNKI